MNEFVLNINKNHPEIKYMAAVALGQSLWGLSYLFTRVALSVTSPEILLSMRFTCALLILSVPLLCKQAHFSIKGKDIKSLLIFAIAQPTYYFFESLGILYTNSAFAGVLLSVSPVVSIFLAKLIMKENPSIKQVMFCFLPIAGVIMITISGSESGIIQPIGVLFLMCTCLLSSILTIYNKKAARSFSSFERTYITVLSGSLVYTCISLHSIHWNFMEYVKPLHSFEYIIALLCLAIFCSIVAGTAVNYGTGKLPVIKSSIFFSVATIISMFSGIFILHEAMTIPALIGSVLIIYGIWKVNTYSPEA